MILGALIDGNGEQQWFYSVHAGWWKEEKDPSIDPFSIQWNRLEAEVKTEDSTPIWILGDLNNPAHVRKEGYDYVKQSGWFDCYELAEQKDNGITVTENIDGWKEKEKITGMRIRSEEHTSELQSRFDLVCRLLLEKKNTEKK